ncbi:MAG: hypothetical protein QXR15_02180, partial [Candidatus Hadarchaeales archaeon]
MNEWIKKSKKLAKEKGYLDKLFNVYPAFPSPEREISEVEEKAIRNAVENKNKTCLIKILLKAEKFPIDHPFVGCFKENESLINKNPRIVDIIGEQLLALGANGIIKGCKAPKKISRRFGGMFHKWINTLGYKVAYSENEFDKCEGIAILGGSDKTRKKYANLRLHCSLKEKGLDLLMKINNKFVIGQAKFITTAGGAQDNQFNEAIRFVSDDKGNAIR